MLLLSRYAFLESNKLKSEERDLLVNDFISQNPKKNLHEFEKEDANSPLAEKLVMGTAYISSIMEAILRYIMILTKINKYFSFLNIFSDSNGKRLQQAGIMIVNLSKISNGNITDDELVSLAQYVHKIPARQRHLVIRLICGIVIYADLLVMLIMYICNNL